MTRLRVRLVGVTMESVETDIALNESFSLQQLAGGIVGNLYM